jgi:hypothetical protein
MTKRSILILLSLIVAAGLTTSCILDPKEEKGGDKDPTPVVFKDLSQKDHVLDNLELAYNERRTDEYDKLLDESFTFIFSEADFSSGEVEFAQWNRADEVGSSEQMLNENSSADDKVVSIDLKIDFPEDSWTEQPANEDHPDESWYFQTVDYNLVIKTQNSWEYRALGKKAQFYIRWATYDKGEHWRIILWRDDVK